MSKKKIYAVMRGRATGVFKTYEECKEQVMGYPNAIYKSFENIEDAKLWLLKGEEGINTISANVLRKLALEIETEMKEV